MKKFSIKLGRGPSNHHLTKAVTMEHDLATVTSNDSPPTIISPTSPPPAMLLLYLHGALVVGRRQPQILLFPPAHTCWSPSESRKLLAEQRGSGSGSFFLCTALLSVPGSWKALCVLFVLCRRVVLRRCCGVMPRILVPAWMRDARNSGARTRRPRAKPKPPL